MLVIRSGTLRQWLTPVPVVVPRGAGVEALGRGGVRGLGSRVVALRPARPDGDPLEIAVAAEDLDQLVGPFVTAALPVSGGGAAPPPNPRGPRRP